MESLKVPNFILQKSKGLKWKDNEESNYGIQRAFCDHLSDWPIYAPYYKSNIDLYDIQREVGFSCYYYLQNYLRPNYQDGQIEGFVTLVDIYRNKRQTMKAGKYLKKIFPFLTDAQVEKAVTYLKAAHSPLEFDLVECGKAESFEYAYKTPHVPKQSPSLDDIGQYTIKSLASSCMRGEYFEGWKVHPAAVYGYGDLRILYAKEKLSGKIGARVIIFPDNESASAIYTANDQATELLVNYLESNDYSARGIDGARVSKISARGDYYLMPYIDDCECAEDCGDYFLLGSGRLSCRSTDGKMYLEELFYCDDCGDSYPEDESTLINGSCVCQYCRDSNYTYSSLMDEYLSSDDCDSNGDGEIATSDWFESNGYVLDYGSVWQIESDCIEFEGEYYHESSHYVVLFNKSYYHEDSEELKLAQEEKEKLDQAYQVKVTHAFGWHEKRVSNGYQLQLTPVMGQYQTQERTLRDNYQLDANGNPERLPEFDFDLVEITPELACI